MIKQLRCKHAWKTLDNSPKIYGCNNCGKVIKVWSWNLPKWKFKREYKGDTFE